MKRYLVIFLFIISFIANSSGMASVWLLLNNASDSMQVMTEYHAQPLQMAEASKHCHDVKVTTTVMAANCDMQMCGACDNCFTHCGGALLTAECPRFVTQPHFLVSIQAHYYTPLISSSFLRPPQIS